MEMYQICSPKEVSRVLLLLSISVNTYLDALSFFALELSGNVSLELQQQNCALALNKKIILAITKKFIALVLRSIFSRFLIVIKLRVI